MKYALQTFEGDASGGPAGVRVPRRRQRQVVRFRFAVALVTFAASAGIAVCVFTLHLGVRPVLTGSMRPDYGPGAVILTRRIPTGSVRPGMIVLFVPPGETATFAHRITSVSYRSGGPVVTTKGDANRTADPWHAQLTSASVNQVIGSVPGAGRLFVAIHGIGQILLALLGGLVAVWAGMKWIFDPSRDLVIE